jgi:hypothetical protein
MKRMERATRAARTVRQSDPLGVQNGVRGRQVSRKPAWNRGSHTSLGPFDKHEVPGSNPGWPTKGLSAKRARLHVVFFYFFWANVVR